MISACMTTVGKKCLFPFKYSNDTHPELTYKICSSLDVYRPWCPTLLNENLEVLEWGDCLDDCPTEAVQKVCIDEPNFPIMADGSDRAVNYTANYTLGSGLVTDEVKSMYFNPLRPDIWTTCSDWHVVFQFSWKLLILFWWKLFDVSSFHQNVFGEVEEYRNRP